MYSTAGPAISTRARHRLDGRAGDQRHQWHVNPDEPTVLDYNTNFKSANHINTLYDPGPYHFIIGPRPR